MNISRLQAVLILGSLLVLVPANLSTADDSDYKGSESCFNCHPSKYNEFIVSGHPYKLTKGEIAKNRPIPLPEGYSWDDISYVIGGYKWKSRYMGLDGYIITSLDTNGDGMPDIDGMNQYNNMTGQWVDYHPGEMKPYDCGRCHTTGFSADGNQDGLPGIHGTWVFEGIQCEECHGAFVSTAYHFDTGPIVDDSAAACGACHIRGDQNTIPASGGFIRHHEQFNEMLASPHYALDCVECHDPHIKSEFSILKTCEDCHGSVAESYAGTEMDVRGVSCTDCHMPYASKSAVAFNPLRGDIQTHIFRITTDPEAELFTEDGKFVVLDDMGQAAMTLDFACLECHTDRSLDWAAEYAEGFHGSDDEDGDEDGDEGGDEVCLCHYPPGNAANGHTICVGQSAVYAHLAHGDTLSPCEENNGSLDGPHRPATALSRVGSSTVNLLNGD